MRFPISKNKVNNSTWRTILEVYLSPHLVCAQAWARACTHTRTYTLTHTHGHFPPVLQKDEFYHWGRLHRKWEVLNSSWDVTPFAQGCWVRLSSRSSLCGWMASLHIAVQWAPEERCYTTPEPFPSIHAVFLPHSNYRRFPPGLLASCHAWLMTCPLSPQMLLAASESG